jgi:NitT/TauT family transport system ATP-binding protein
MLTIPPTVKTVDIPSPQVMEPPPIVQFDHVSVEFTKFIALSDISFVIKKENGNGQFICVVGPSGCGKSTMLNVIAGLQMPTDGEATVNGKLICGPGRDRGMIFQQYSSFPHLTVFKNIMFGMKINHVDLSHAERKDKVMQMIEAVELQDHYNKYPHQLSGGQQQRVAIARTLILEPQVVLMDEPFSALDEPTRYEMQELVVNLWFKIQPCIFCVTHSVTEAVYLADRVWIMTKSPGQIAVEIRDCIPPSLGIKPQVAQEDFQFKVAAKVVTEAFQQVVKNGEM